MHIADFIMRRVNPTFIWRLLCCLSFAVFCFRKGVGLSKAHPLT